LEQNKVAMQGTSIEMQNKLNQQQLLEMKQKRQWGIDLMRSLGNGAN
jgi:hypothetical protein